MNFDFVSKACDKRIAQIKDVATTTEPYTWSNYDVLSLIKRIENQSKYIDLLVSQLNAQEE